MAGTGGLDQTAVFQEGGKAGWAGIDLRAGIRDNRLGGGIDRRRALYAHGGGGEGGGIFALRRPRPYSRHCGEAVAGYATPTIILYPCRHQLEHHRRIATRYAAS